VQHFQELTGLFFQDLAIHLRGEGFEWRWETFSIGPKQSAEVLSKHLMIPLLSTAYLAFISPDAISEISGSGLEKVGFFNSPTQFMSTLVSDRRGANPPCPIMGPAGPIAPTAMTEQEILCTRILSLWFSSPSIPVSIATNTGNHHHI
jgi:hypothetical protein